MKCNNPGCDNDIPAKSLAKHKDQKFCCQECFTQVNTERLKARGHYQKLSQAGNESQSQYKARHGRVPGYENRARALKDPGHHRKRDV